MAWRAYCAVKREHVPPATSRILKSILQVKCLIDRSAPFLLGVVWGSTNDNDNQSLRKISTSQFFNTQSSLQLQVTAPPFPGSRTSCSNQYYHSALVHLHCHLQSPSGATTRLQHRSSSPFLSTSLALSPFFPHPFLKLLSTNSHRCNCALCEN